MFNDTILQQPSNKKLQWFLSWDLGDSDTHVQLKIEKHWTSVNEDEIFLSVKLQMWVMVRLLVKRKQLFDCNFIQNKLQQLFPWIISDNWTRKAKHTSKTDVKSIWVLCADSSVLLFIFSASEVLSKNYSDFTDGAGGRIRRRWSRVQYHSEETNTLLWQCLGVFV